MNRADAACAEGQAVRQSGAAALAQALQNARRDTLATFGLYETALAARDFTVPQSLELNPPLWELGHIGWFQTHWIGRNPERLLGVAADPFVPRLPAARHDADALYDSSRIEQATRWSLDLPGAQATQADLADGLAQSLDLLLDPPHGCHSNDSLYFHRLCLLHEDMHHEAALYMAQSLGIAVVDPRWQPRPVDAATPLKLNVTDWTLGSSAGFAFDNELGAHAVPLAPWQIDSQVLRWADYLPFVEAGGADAGAPRYLRRQDGVWQQQRWGRWQALDLNLPACHLTFFEAQAFCAWAGRRLPTEAEWECAAMTLGDSRGDSRGRPFQWGSVWEWTASPFEPYPGFVAHPYRDYSQPWFDGRPVLRGGSYCTQPRLKNRRYRNYFSPKRNDIFAGFRTCAI